MMLKLFISFIQGWKKQNLESEHFHITHPVFLRFHRYVVIITMIIFELFDTKPEKKARHWLQKTQFSLLLYQSKRFLIWFSRKWNIYIYWKKKKVMWSLWLSEPFQLASEWVHQTCRVIIFNICKAIGPWSEGICDNRKRNTFF